jgi:hypothetical protein
MKSLDKFFKKPITHSDEVSKLSRRALMTGGLGLAGLALAGCGESESEKRVRESNDKFNARSVLPEVNLHSYSPDQIEVLKDFKSDFDESKGQTREQVFANYANESFSTNPEFLKIFQEFKEAVKDAGPRKLIAYNNRRAYSLEDGNKIANLTRAKDRVVSEISSDIFADLDLIAKVFQIDYREMLNPAGYDILNTNPNGKPFHWAYKDAQGDLKKMSVRVIFTDRDSTAMYSIRFFNSK